MIDLPQTPFTRLDLEVLGVRRHEFFDLLAGGLIRPVLHEVYVGNSVPDDLDVRIAACARVLKPGQIVVDRTAAWLHGVDTRTWGERDVPPAVEVCGADDREPVRRDGVAGGRRQLQPTDLMPIDGLIVTTPLRTALDLGRRLRRREAYAAVCELARLHSLMPTDFESEIPRFKGRRGVIQLRELTRLIDARYESPREAWVWLAINDAGLPTPIPQVWVETPDGDRWRLDFAYVHKRIAVEYDGEEFHTGDEQTRHDAERRQQLRMLGWRIVVVKRGDFAATALERWLAELKQLLNTDYDPYRW